MSPLRIGCFLALLAALVLSATDASGQAPGADLKKLEELLKQKGINLPPEQLAKIQESLKQKGITPQQLEMFMKMQGGLGGKLGGFKGKGAAAPSMQDSLAGPLVAPEVLAKLNLSVTQRPAYDKLSKEFDAKIKEITAKLPAAPPGGDLRAKIEADLRAKFNKGGGSAPPSPEVQKALTLRDDYEKKFEEMLTEPQKKILADIRLKANEALLLGGK